MNNRFILFLAFVSLLLAGGTALSHKGATGIIKIRMDEMKQLGEHMKGLAEMAKGDTPIDAAKISTAAAEMGRIANNIPELFPPNSLEHPSEATATIWSQWPDFKIEAASLSVLSSQLAADAETLATPEELQAKLGQLGETCKSCHETFRLKK